MKKYLKFDIAFYTIVVLISLVIAIVSCGDGPHKKRKGEWKKHYTECKSTNCDSLKSLRSKRVKIWMDRDTIHSDSAKQVRKKLWKKRIKKRKDYKK